MRYLVFVLVFVLVFASACNSVTVVPIDDEDAGDGGATESGDAGNDG
jgi:hypothetical protein